MRYVATTFRHTDIQTYIHTDRQTEPKYDIDICVFRDSTAGFYTFVNHLNSLIYITLHNMYIFTTIYIIENFTPFHIFEDL